MRTSCCEKYKNMARDAHQQGDRVMNEYYLQFADHYFRILAEANNRKDDQQRDREDTRKPRQSDDRDNSGNRDNADNRQNADDRNNDDDGDDGDDRDEGRDEVKADVEDKPKRRPRKPAKQAASSQGNGGDQPNGGEKIEADRLPGAIGLSADRDDDEPAAAKPARKAMRARTPKADDGKGPSAEV